MDQDIKSDLHYVRERVDHINDKLDNHLERISKTESDISWLKGHVKIVTTMVITILGAIASFVIEYLI